MRLPSSIKLPAYGYSRAHVDDFDDDGLLQLPEPYSHSLHQRRFIIGLLMLGAFGSGVLVTSFAFSTVPQIVQHGKPTVETATSTSNPASTPFGISDNNPTNAKSQVASPVRIHYDEDPGINEQSPIYDCPVPVIYTTDRKAADVVVWNADKRNGGNFDRVKAREERPYQFHVIKGIEAAPQRTPLYEHFRKVSEGRRNETFDYDMSYRLDGAVPALYAYGYMDFATRPLPFEQKRQDKVAAVFMSNCSPMNARNLVLKELMDLLPGQIDSFGTCLNNANADEVLKELGRWDLVSSAHTRWNVKISTVASYKFTIAFENSNAVDYVTEKAFQAFERGSVPIHMGSPTFSSSFTPGSNTAIDLSDYLPQEYLDLSTPESTPPEELSRPAKEGLKKLAERLNYLSSQEGKGEYEDMLSWKNNPNWEDSPLGEVVRLGRMRYPENCRLAGIVRGEAWAETGWKRPNMSRILA